MNPNTAKKKSHLIDSSLTSIPLEKTKLFKKKKFTRQNLELEMFYFSKSIYFITPRAIIPVVPDWMSALFSISRNNANNHKRLKRMRERVDIFDAREV